MSNVEIVADCRDACGEGPLWDERARMLFWLDINNGKLHKLAWESGSVESIDLSVPASALALTGHGDLIAAGSAGIWLLKEDQAPQLLAQSYDGKPLAINDSIVDARGRLLAGSTFFDGTDNYPPGYLYRFDSDASLHVLDEGFLLANGMGFSPDNETLYVTDSVRRIIYSYNYSIASGQAANRKVFVQVPASEGLPDGLTVDNAGFVWSAQWFGRCVCRYDPEGKLERRIAIAADQPSSVAFGGPDLTTLFITSAATPDAEALAPSGYSRSSNTGGQLFRIDPGFAGRAEYRVRLAESIPGPQA